MSIFTPIFDTIRDKILEALYDEAMRIHEDEKQRWERALEIKEQTLSNDLKGWIENDIPIPNYIKNEYPYFTADYCVNADKPHLVKELLPMYYKQRKIVQRREIIERRVTVFCNLLNFLMGLSVVLLILYLIYRVISGPPY